MDEHIKDYNFHKIGKAVINLLTNQISALYYTSIKDRLYCESLESFSRRTAQYTLLQIFDTITRTIAPMVPHLAEEMYHYLPQRNSKTYFTKNHENPNSSWQDESLENVMEDILNCRRDINKRLETGTFDADVTITCSKEFFLKLKVGHMLWDSHNFNYYTVSICRHWVLYQTWKTNWRIFFKFPRLY